MAILRAYLAVEILRRENSGWCRDGWGNANCPGCITQRTGVNIMMRKVMMALAAVAVVTVGSASTAAAFRGGFGGGHMGGAHFSGSHFSSFGRPGMAFSGHPFVGRHFDRFGHDRFFRHRFGHRFVFLGAGFPYGYYDNCYARVWTPWGWRWRYVCY